MGGMTRCQVRETEKQSWVRVSLLGCEMQLQTVHAQYVLESDVVGEDKVRRIARTVVGEM